MSAPDLILASTSPYRRELLERLKLPFRALAPGVDEAGIAGEAPQQRAQRLAFLKAEALAASQPDSCVIGSDQVASCRGQIFDKPGNAERCRQQLRLLSGHQASFHTAVSVLCIARQYRVDFIDVTTVVFRELTAAEIDRYIEIDQPFNCAGGFRCETLGVALFEELRSADATGLIGLPLIQLTRALRPLGFALP
ncbi:MAG: nucleoside triphosphate pyrophosphatase [Steroidobacteraceae bacterium]